MIFGKKEDRLSNDELQARLKFFIGCILGLTLFGIVFVVLYSLIFVTQPMNGMSPVDNKFFELIIPIATFLTGTLSGIMLAGSTKEEQEAMMQAHKVAQENADKAAAAAKEYLEVQYKHQEAAAARSFPAPVPQPAGPVTTNAAGKAVVPEFKQPEL